MANGEEKAIGFEKQKPSFTKINLITQTTQAFDENGVVHGDFNGQKIEYPLFYNFEQIGLGTHLRGTEFSQDWDMYSNEIDSAESEIVSLNTNLDALTLRLTDVNTNITETNSVISSKTDELGVISTNLSIANNDLTYVQSLIPALEASVLAAQAYYDSVSAPDSGADEATIADALSALTAAQTALDAGNADVVTYQANVDTLTADYTKVEGELVTLNEQLAALTSSKESVESEINATNNDLDYYTNFIAGVSPKTFSNYLAWTNLNNEKALAAHTKDNEKTFSSLYSTIGLGYEGAVAKKHVEFYQNQNDPKVANADLEAFTKKIDSISEAIKETEIKLKEAEKKGDADLMLKLNTKLVSLNDALYGVNRLFDFAQQRANGNFLPINKVNQIAFEKVYNDMYDDINMNSLAAADRIESMIRAYQVARLVSNSFGDAVDSIEETIIQANTANINNQSIYFKLVGSSFDAATNVITLSNPVYVNSQVLYVNGVAYTADLLNSTVVDANIKGLPQLVTEITVDGVVLDAITAGGSVAVYGVAGDFTQLVFKN